MNSKVLYVEDEPFLGRIVFETLQQQGFDVRLVVDGALVIQLFKEFVPDIVVLDIMLPNCDGYTLCTEINKLAPKIPILFLTAKTETTDLVKGFEMGGSDYLRKPFSLEELIIRIKNLLRMHSLPQKVMLAEEGITIGKYLLMKSRYELISPTKVIKLSARDMQVVDMLVQNINHVVDRRQLLLQVWGDDSFFNSRTLDVYIRKLREYLAEDPSIELVTLKGKGYLFMVR